MKRRNKRWSPGLSTIFSWSTLPGGGRVFPAGFKSKWKTGYRAF